MWSVLAGGYGASYEGLGVGACVDAKGHPFTRTWAKGVDLLECRDCCSQRPNCIGHEYLVIGNDARVCNLLSTGMAPFLKGGWMTEQNSGVGPITGTNITSAMKCYRKTAGPCPRRQLPGLPMHHRCILVSYLACSHVSLLLPRLDSALTTPDRMCCCCSVRSRWGWHMHGCQRHHVHALHELAVYRIDNICRLRRCLCQGKSQLLPPAPPYYPFPRVKIHTRGNIWSFTVG